MELLLLALASLFVFGRRDGSGSTSSTSSTSSPPPLAPPAPLHTPDQTPPLVQPGGGVGLPMTVPPMPQAAPPATLPTSAVPTDVGALVGQLLTAPGALGALLSQISANPALLGQYLSAAPQLLALAQQVAGNPVLAQMAATLLQQNPQAAVQLAQLLAVNPQLLGLARQVLGAGAGNGAGNSAGNPLAGAANLGLQGLQALLGGGAAASNAGQQPAPGDLLTSLLGGLLTGAGGAGGGLNQAAGAAQGLLGTIFGGGAPPAGGGAAPPASTAPPSDAARAAQELVAQLSAGHYRWMDVGAASIVRDQIRASQRRMGLTGGDVDGIIGRTTAARANALLGRTAIDPSTGRVNANTGTVVVTETNTGANDLWGVIRANPAQRLPLIAQALMAHPTVLQRLTRSAPSVVAAAQRAQATGDIAGAMSPQAWEELRQALAGDAELRAIVAQALGLGGAASGASSSSSSLVDQGLGFLGSIFGG